MDEPQPPIERKSADLIDRQGPSGREVFTQRWGPPHDGDLALGPAELEIP